MQLACFNFILGSWKLQKAKIIVTYSYKQTTIPIQIFYLGSLVNDNSVHKEGTIDNGQTRIQFKLYAAHKKQAVLSYEPFNCFSFPALC